MSILGTIFYTSELLPLLLLTSWIYFMCTLMIINKPAFFLSCFLQQHHAACLRRQSLNYVYKKPCSKRKLHDSRTKLRMLNYFVRDLAESEQFYFIIMQVIHASRIYGNIFYHFIQKLLMWLACQIPLLQNFCRQINNRFCN